jgi:hypothetical protein
MPGEDFLSKDDSAFVPSEAPPQLISIFLNLWVPVSDKYVGKSWERSEKTSMRIALEQLQQIGQSYVATQDTTIYFTVVGRNSLNQTFLDSLCEEQVPSRPNLHCVLSNTDSLPYGGELDTLSNMYEFCAQTENPAMAKAIYLHNKGSFHPDPKNDRWRCAMTDAVVSRQCAKPPDDSCNVCGLQFNAPPQMFTMLFPGNFFTASCKYINQLHPPKEFQRRMERLAWKAKNLNSTGTFHFLPKGDQNWVLGTKRYTPEHWIGMHPQIQPCDMSVQPNNWYWQEHDHTSDEFQWSMFYNRRFNYSNDKFMADTPDLRLKTYIILPGLLWRYVSLYNQTPSETSWIYDVLPDGNLWRAAVKNQGHRAIGALLGANDEDIYLT